MKIINIPAYSYFTGDTKSYRTDQVLLCSDSFIENMLNKYPTITSTTKIVYQYNGNAIPFDAYKNVNKFLGDNLLPYLGVPYNALYQSNFLPTDPNYKPIWDTMNHVLNSIGLRTNFFQVSDNVTPGSGYTQPSQIVCLNNSNLGRLYVGEISSTKKQGYNLYGSGVYSMTYGPAVNLSPATVNLNGMIYPENLFNEDGLAPLQENKYGILYNVLFKYNVGSILSDSGVTEITVTLYAVKNYYWSYLNDIFSNFDPALSGMTETDESPDDPYTEDGNSKPGGGDGAGGGGWLDSIDPAQIPPLPNINVCDLGLITMYNPSQGDVKLLSDFLWSNAFDLNTYKKLFGNPMEGIIGLAIVPVSPDLAGAKNVKIGNIDTGVTMSYLSSNWKEIDCGWCDIEKFVGCFMDADPYTKISIYLPFIGIRSLSADDVNGGSIHVVYHVDVLTGACACFIEHSERGVLYTYNGSCITNVPLTSINFSGAIQNAVSAVISGIGMAAGMATGAAPVTAMSAAGLLNSAANAALNSKPQIQRSGNLGGSAGILSILSPYCIIERPDISIPANMSKHVGNVSNMTYTLGSISGFTMCEYVHIEKCTGTSEEIKEIETLLKEGVYL